MKSLYFFLTISLIVSYALMTGCSKDWLEVKGDKRTSTISSINDLQALMDNILVLNTNTLPTSPEVAADGHYITEATWTRYLGTVNQNRYTWTNTVPYESNADWIGPYVAILTCNVVLANADKFDSDPRIAAIKAQAYFFRAFAMLNIATTFAPSYNPATAGKDLGIPLRLTDDISESSIRSTVQESFSQILSDLQSSLQGLATASNVQTQPTKAAAQALLARTYLYMRDFANAQKFAEQCLSSKSDLLDYSQIPDDAPSIGLNKEIIFLALLPSSREITRDYLVDPELFNLYEGNDKRKTVFFIKRGQNIQFKGTYTTTTSNYFAGTAVDEIMLIKAECQARSGKIPEAMATLNKLVRTRYAKNEDGTSTYVDQPATDVKDALTRILAERRKQLILRNIRWMDLKRIGLDPEQAASISRSIGGQTYSLEPGSFKYTFPIPLDIIRASSMQQNPGWE